MIRDHERFAKLAAGVQSLSVVFGLIVGGSWAYYTFSAQLQADNARAQLDLLKLELSRRAALEIEIEASTVQYLNNHVTMMLSANIRNVGTADAELELTDEPFRATRIISLEDGSLIFGQTVAGKPYGTSLSGNKIEAFTSVYARVGDLERVVTVLSVDGPGLYLIEFTAPMAQDEAGESTWTGQTYAYVAPSPDNSQ